MAQPEPYVMHLEPGQRNPILLNHVGFKTDGVKQFLVAASASSGFSDFEVLGPAGIPVYAGKLTYAGATAEWTVGGSMWTGDFSDLRASGVGFRIRLSATSSSETVVDSSEPAAKKVKTTTSTTTTTTRLLSERFDIGDTLVTDLCVPDIIHYFRSQRVAGKYAKKDYAVAFAPNEDGTRKEGTVDLHGGWYDASGDMSKYLSHLSYASFMNPQQTPLVTWSLLESADGLNGGATDRLKSFITPLREEALYGCDFLVRMQAKEGYFYQTLFDKWSKDVNQREICEYATQKGHKYTTWEAGYRQGAGMAIASLARASALPNEFIATTAEYSGNVYLNAAEVGFRHLEVNNVNYLNDKTENIIDHYCALVAASELYAATKKEEYLTAARSRAQKLMEAQVSNDAVSYFWMANGKSANDPEARPFFHASDAGLPVISLCRYAQVEIDTALVEAAKLTVARSMEFELGISKEVNNPFMYPRQYTKAVGSVAKTAFFFPHQNESGYWWQGENARLGSLSVAASKAHQLLASSADAEFLRELDVFRTSAIDWVLGKNPYDMCMLQGRGRRNPDYLPQYANAPGGICNGITGGFENEDDICFKPDPHGADWAENWRWGEQWIPHAGWFVLAAVLH
ncbi:Six-hairpin glycosidase-like protein [Chytriomyces sp. MP71]|nr:Six-hairpin glycosidase-like protein [Chytriomyces sp. MP71]